MLRGIYIIDSVLSTKSWKVMEIDMRYRREKSKAPPQAGLQKNVFTMNYEP
jgi:hypothetical protein